MKTIMSFLFFVTLVSSAAADTFTVAADSSSKTYAKMLGELIGACSNENLDIKQAQGVTGGAPGNLEALVNNKAQAAFMHSDVFQAHVALDASYKRYQTLVALYPEPIHVVALRVSKTLKKEGGVGGYFQKDVPVTFNTLDDVRGYTVGAAGGGVYTAQILQANGEGGFNVSDKGNGDAVMAALNSGEIAVAIFVGAAPLPNLEKLDKNKYKIIPVGDTIANKTSIKTYYRSASINYPGLTAGAIKTIAPMATIMTRKYDGEKKVAMQRSFRDCFNRKLGDLRDDGSPGWQQVIAGDHGVLDWYEISSSKNK